MKWRTATAEDFDEDWMFSHYRYKFSNEKLDTDLFEVKDGALVKIGGTGTLSFSGVEILDEEECYVLNSKQMGVLIMNIINVGRSKKDLLTSEIFAEAFKYLNSLKK